MFDSSQLYALAVMALVVGSIAVTITRSKIFAGVREWIAEKTAAQMVKNDGVYSVFGGNIGLRFWKFLHGVFTCPYCMGHWLSFALIAWYQPRPLTSDVLLVDMVVSAFALVTMSSWASGLIVKGMKA